MIWFLLKGLLRDRQRSLLPIIIVSSGVMITILLHCWILGISDSTIDTNARLDTGHVKIMSRAYADIASQIPNDLSLPGVSRLMPALKQDYPEISWAPRIKFGGLMDFPDEKGETRAQGPVFGIALDLISPDSNEKNRFNLESALIQGHLPTSLGEIIISDAFATSLQVKPGDMATLISATSSGSMAIHNFIVAGTIRFGISAMDRNTVLADISDIQYALDMEDSAGEVLGFFPNMIYKNEPAKTIAADFNHKFLNAEEELSPIMLTLGEQNNLGDLLNIMEVSILIAITVLVSVMSIVLWNTGLMSGLRRYGEVGVRLAIGESKSHVYRTMIYESILIGFIGSGIGTIIGIGISYFLQEHGLDMSGIMKSSTMLFSNVMRARISFVSFYIGFIPGLLAMLLGTMIAGIGIFKRQTSQLFKELET